MHGILRFDGSRVPICSWCIGVLRYLNFELITKKVFYSNDEVKILFCKLILYCTCVELMCSIPQFWEVLGVELKVAFYLAWLRAPKPFKHCQQVYHNKLDAFALMNYTRATRPRLVFKSNAEASLCGAPLSGDRPRS